MSRKVVINESEKNKILNLHNQTNLLFEGEVVVTDWISEDNKYAVFMDNLFDIENKKDLGNIWKSSDNLFLFLEHSIKVSSLTSIIKEDSQNFFSNRVLLESNMDLTVIKPIIKKLLKEDFWKDTWVGKGLSYAGKFAKDTAVGTVTGITSTFSQAWDGIKAAGIAISKGDFKELMKQIGRGFLWAGRKIRSAAYSVVGMIIDAILLATAPATFGGGKIAQAIVWAIIVMVDIYEFITGDYEHPGEPLWMRVLFFGCDVLGLVFAGAAAKASRVAIKGAVGGAKVAAEMGPKIAANPTVMGLIKQMVGAVKELPAKLTSVSAKLGKTGFWGGLVGKAMSGVGKFIKMFLDSIASLFTKKEMRPVLIQLGLIGGLGVYGEYAKEKGEKESKETEQEFAQLMQKQTTKDADISDIVNTG